MPLADTPFNRAKSDLKFIEAGACRVAALASHIVYANSVEDGRTGLLFHALRNCATGFCVWWPCPSWRAVWAMRRGTMSRASVCWRIRWATDRVVSLAMGAARGTEHCVAGAADGRAPIGRRGRRRGLPRTAAELGALP